MHTRSSDVNAKRLLHIGVHNSANRNAGDTLLFPVVRKAFEAMLGPCDWVLRQAWELFTEEDASRINREFDGIIIGGGGLLLRDQAGSDVVHSGWQWNSTVTALQALSVPVIVFAIGYNRFRGQADFAPVFKDHIRMLSEKSAFFSLRNTGSINGLKDYLLAEQHDKLVRQFCPTTVLWQLYPEYRELMQSHDEKSSHVLAFNAAFDRAHLRFGDKADEILMNVARALLVAQQRGWSIILTAHKTIDRQFEGYLDRVGVTFDTVDLTEASPEEIITFYAQIDFALGMRGHAQMIPFGLRRPIMSIISHDKMRFLLEDIERADWGVEVSSPDFIERVERALAAIEKDREAIHLDLAAVQQGVWEETKSNFQLIAHALVSTDSSRDFYVRT
ncbi:polysaccharide pyruvyl transferase family protein [Luminiphilus sp.]|nr:polysaccharide pyruvyl transferase family protein [Luminiphilus sp.]